MKFTWFKLSDFDEIIVKHFNEKMATYGGKN